MNPQTGEDKSESSQSCAAMIGQCHSDDTFQKVERDIHCSCFRYIKVIYQVYLVLILRPGAEVHFLSSHLTWSWSVKLTLKPRFLLFYLRFSFSVIRDICLYGESKVAPLFWWQRLSRDVNLSKGAADLELVHLALFLSQRLKERAFPKFTVSRIPGYV